MHASQTSVMLLEENVNITMLTIQLRNSWHVHSPRSPTSSEHKSFQQSSETFLIVDILFGSSSEPSDYRKYTINMAYS